MLQIYRGASEATAGLFHQSTVPTLACPLQRKTTIITGKTKWPTWLGVSAEWTQCHLGPPDQSHATGGCSRGGAVLPSINSPAGPNSAYKTLAGDRLCRTQRGSVSSNSVRQ